MTPSVDEPAMAEGKAAEVTRVGVYVDAFNVYYGAREQCGRRTPGWRWLDLPTLVMGLVDPGLWPGPRLERFVYCTADRDRAGDPTSITDQPSYIAALQAACPRMTVAKGFYAPRVKSGVLVAGPRSRRRVTSPGASELPTWLPAREVTGPDGASELLVSVGTFEEKGSDVNVASHLLVDTLDSTIDAAIVVSNDSDLQVPTREARRRVPVGTVNPTPRPTAAALRGHPTDGAGRHWWRRLNAEDYLAHQLLSPIGGHTRPAGW